MLVRPHLSIASARRTRRTRPDASLLADIVAPKVLEALRLSTEALTRAGVRHVVVGGLAVCVHGSPRNTALVEFLLGSEAFHQHPSGLVTLRADVRSGSGAISVLAGGHLNLLGGADVLTGLAGSIDLVAGGGSIALSPTSVLISGSGDIALQAAGVTTVNSPAELGAAMKRALQ